MNKKKRIWHSLRMCMIFSNYKRAEYLRRHKIFNRQGNNCGTMMRRIPNYPELISLGDNVHMGSNVQLIPHDATHLMLNTCLDRKFKETMGCISIGDNVFIGAHAIILCNTKIGSNVIVGAGSVVNKDIPDNCVAAGVPARVICSFDDYVSKRMRERTYPDGMKPIKQDIPYDLKEWCWENFNRQRQI